MILCLIALIVFAPLPSFAQEYQEVTPERSAKFPEDFYYRDDYKVQWWYFTGHLSDEKGREFGYELTFFVVGVQKREYRSRFGVKDIYISHFSLSDIKEKRFHFSDKTDSGAFDFSGAKQREIDVWVGNHALKGTPEKMHIQASDKDKAIDLVLVPTKPLVLHGDRGYSRKSGDSPLNASLYFSYTNLRTAGTLRIGDTLFTVTGKSWFDREISSRGLGRDLVGWDWFALKLDDNREIMLYLLRKRDGSLDPYSSGTFVYSDGTYRRLSKDDFSLAVLDHYRSKRTGARYPSRWEVKIPSEGLTLAIIPLIKDQEFTAPHSTLNYYWEGTCSVEGAVRGRAYVEMTGY